MLPHDAHFICPTLNGLSATQGQILSTCKFSLLDFFFVIIKWHHGDKVTSMLHEFKLIQYSKNTLMYLVDAYISAISYEFLYDCFVSSMAWMRVSSWLPLSLVLTFLCGAVLAQYEILLCCYCIFSCRELFGLLKLMYSPACILKF